MQSGNGWRTRLACWLVRPRASLPKPARAASNLMDASGFAGRKRGVLRGRGPLHAGARALPMQSPCIFKKWYAMAQVNIHSRAHALEFFKGAKAFRRSCWDLNCTGTLIPGGTGVPPVGFSVPQGRTSWHLAVYGRATDQIRSLLKVRESEDAPSTPLRAGPRQQAGRLCYPGVDAQRTRWVRLAESRPCGDRVRPRLNAEGTCFLSRRDSRKLAGGGARNELNHRITSPTNIRPGMGVG